LAAALCLRAFVLSDSMSIENERRDNGVLLAQNAAEVYKACCGDAEAAAEILGGVADQNAWSSYYDEDLAVVNDPETAVYTVNVLPQQADAAGMGCAAVSVFLADESESLFELSVAWQKEGLHG